MSTCCPYLKAVIVIVGTRSFPTAYVLALLVWTYPWCRKTTQNIPRVKACLGPLIGGLLYQSPSLISPSHVPASLHPYTDCPHHAGGKSLASRIAESPSCLEDQSTGRLPNPLHDLCLLCLARIRSQRSPQASFDSLNACEGLDCS